MVWQGARSNPGPYADLGYVHSTRMIYCCASPLHIRDIAPQDWYAEAQHRMDTALGLGELTYAILDQAMVKVD